MTSDNRPIDERILEKRSEIAKRRFGGEDVEYRMHWNEDEMLEICRFATELGWGIEYMGAKHFLKGSEKIEDVSVSPEVRSVECGPHCDECERSGIRGVHLF